MKLALLSSSIIKDKHTLQKITNHYQFHSIEEADIILCAGGDGFLLRCLQNYYHLNKPFYGINMGSVGFLLNTLTNVEELLDNIQSSQSVSINPLQAIITKEDETTEKKIAFNDFSIQRDTSLAAHLSLAIDSNQLIEKFVSDGILVATPLGSTAYNKACNGSAIPVNSNLLAITPINVFKPLGMKSAIVQNNHIITISNLSPRERPVHINGDFYEHGNAKSVQISIEKKIEAQLLFNKSEDIDMRYLKSEFKSHV